MICFETIQFSEALWKYEQLRNISNEVYLRNQQRKNMEYEVVDNEMPEEEFQNRLSTPQEELKINVEEHLNENLEIENTNPHHLENNPFIYGEERETPDQFKQKKLAKYTTKQKANPSSNKKHNDVKMMKFARMVQLEEQLFKNESFISDKSEEERKDYHEFNSAYFEHETKYSKH